MLDTTRINNVIRSFDAENCYDCVARNFASLHDQAFDMPLLSIIGGEIYLTKRYGEQVDIDKLNPQQSKKVMGVWKNPLRGTTKKKHTPKRRYKNRTTL